jgi:hypothetical protein
MEEETTMVKALFTRVLNWLRNELIGDVPEDMGLCEFECNKKDCTQGEWEFCERRLQQAGGELMPQRGVTLNRSSIHQI